MVALLIDIVSPVATTSDAKFAMHVALSLYKGLHGELTPLAPCRPRASGRHVEVRAGKQRAVRLRFTINLFFAVVPAYIESVGFVRLWR